MIAAITLRFLDPFGTGKLVLFQVTYDKVSNFLKCDYFHSDIFLKDWHAYELIFFIVLGIFGVSFPRNFCHSHADSQKGVYGAYFSKLNILWSRHVRNGTWLRSHPVAEVLLVSSK